MNEIIIMFKICDFELLERLYRYSMEFDKPLEVLINAAIKKFVDDIEAVHKLRL